MAVFKFPMTFNFTSFYKMNERKINRGIVLVERILVLRILTQGTCWQTKNIYFDQCISHYFIRKTCKRILA